MHMHKQSQHFCFYFRFNFFSSGVQSPDYHIWEGPLNENNIYDDIEKKKRKLMKKKENKIGFYIYENTMNLFKRRNK